MAAAPGPRGWFGRRVVEVTAAGGRTPMPENRHAAPPEPELAAPLPPVAARPVILARGLRERLAQLAALDDAYAPIEVFVGPPGVGKTVTIAKIASQERAHNGYRLGLVAADGFRVGAVEQLRRYAGVLESPLAVAHTPFDLQTILETATVPVLVDTAGRSSEDEASAIMLRVLASRPGVRTHLVLAADTSASTARRLLDRFASASPTRVVVTKVDETESLEPLLGVLLERELAISYLGTGQRVPEDLQPATPRALAAWLAGGEPAGASA
jgi:flagellar biosynthesis protein FlhF